MKHEWRKKEKETYLPSTKPTLIDVENYIFLALEGTGNPNSKEFNEQVEALYALSYGVRMCYKKDYCPDSYYSYTVYPLEGEWDLVNPSLHCDNKLDKDNLKYTIMIRQPYFLNENLFNKVLDDVLKKKKNRYLQEVKMTQVNEGKCVQMLHVGSYDTENVSFSMMQNYCNENSLKRVSKTHREIYISDPRKVEAVNLKTVLRIKVEDI